MTMLVATPPTISGCASSDTAVHVEKSIKKSQAHLQLSNALGLVSSGIFQKLNEVIRECSSEGWDGEQAKPISIDVVRNACHFLALLPLGTKPPDIDSEPDGAITLEWYHSPEKVLSVSIDSDNRLSYATLIGTSQRSGVDSVGMDISEDLLELINKVVE